MQEGLHLEELGEIPFDEKEILRYAMLPSSRRSLRNCRCRNA